MGVLLRDNGIPFCLTLENPWLDNETSISCIPTGLYKCKIVNSPRYGEVYEVMNVKHRTHILIHSGNTEADTRGCILVGQSFGELKGEPAVLNSKVTLRALYSITNNLEFDLEIVDA